MSGRHWTKRELATLRRCYGKVTSADLAKRLKRTRSSVVQRARIEGLSDRNQGRGIERETILRSMHADGYSDADISTRLKVSRGQVSQWRRKLGLPSNSHNERHVAKLRERKDRQCKEWGVRNLGELRVKAWRQKVAASGWPEDLPPRAAEILNLLWDRGPMTRREICQALGLKWRGSRVSLKSRGKGGSWLAILMRRGLVVYLGRRVKTGARKGSHAGLYSLPLTLERK